MEDYRNNEILGVDRKQMQAVDGKQEIYLEWPYLAFLVGFINKQECWKVLAEVLASYHTRY